MAILGTNYSPFPSYPYCNALSPQRNQKNAPSRWTTHPPIHPTPRSSALLCISFPRRLLDGPPPPPLPSKIPSPGQYDTYSTLRSKTSETTTYDSPRQKKTSNFPLICTFNTYLLYMYGPRNPPRYPASTCTCTYTYTCTSRKYK